MTSCALSCSTPVALRVVRGLPTYDAAVATGGEARRLPPSLSLSAPEQIAATLREDLLDGALLPGERLREEHLSSRFGVGRHSVRAALKLLEAGGLLVHERHRGAFVPALTRERIDSAFEFRTVIELGSLRLALARGADLEPVELAVQALEALPQDTPWRVLTECHGHIHYEIVRASHNDRLLSSYRSCKDELQLLFASIRPDFSAARLATLHRHLMNQLRTGGDVAIKALHDDLELAGRGALLTALERETSPGADVAGTHAPLD